MTEEPDTGLSQLELTDNELHQIQTILNCMDNLNTEERYRALKYVVSRKLPKYSLY